MKSFFIPKQLKYCDSKISCWLKPFRTSIKMSLVMLFTFILSSNLNAQLCPGSGPILINGNPADWPAALNNTANIRKAFTPDINSELNKGALDDGFTQGTSNNQPIEDWRWVYGQTNSKGDIENAGALLLGNKLYFFGDRSAFNGTCEIGFWFLLDKVAPTGDGGTPGSPFSGTHKNGDLMVLNTFTSGGGAATPKVFMWQGKTATAPGGLVELINASSCSRTNETTTYTAPGGVPGVVIDLNTPPGPSNPAKIKTWKFDAKDVASERDPAIYYPPLFFEGVVDLGSIPGASPCFQSFIMKTTTSANNTAANVDLVAGEFSGIPDPPVVVGDEKCYGFAAEATATCTGSTAQWYNATTGALITTGSSLTLPAGTAAGTYTYNVTCKTLEGCESAPKAVSIKINPLPTVIADVSIVTGITAIAPGLDCPKQFEINVAKIASNPPTAKLTATNGNPAIPIVSYSWTRSPVDALTTFTGANTATPTFSINDKLAVGTNYRFIVEATDANGCKDKDTVCITSTSACPPFDICGPKKACVPANGLVYSNCDLATGQTRVLDGDYDYTWSIIGSNAEIVGASLNVASITVNVTAAGGYSVKLAVKSKNGFVDCGSKTYDVDTRQVSCTVKNDGNVSCKGVSDGKATVTAVNGFEPYTYLWDNGETTQQATKLSAGEHTVTVTDAQKCVTTCKVTITEPDLLVAKCVTDKNVSCKNGSDGQITGSATGGTTPYSFSLDDVTYVTSGVFSGLKAGTYTIYVKDKNGCKANTSCSITEPPLLTCTVTLVASTECFKNNGSATANPSGGTSPYTYKWDNGETTQTAVSLSKGSHSVEVTDAKGCKTTCTVNIPELPCAHIFPTATACCHFTQGIAQQQVKVCYTKSGSSISNVIPGVFFYYSNIIAPASGPFEIKVTQSNNNASFKLFSVQNADAGQIRLYTTGCGSVSFTGTVSGPNSSIATLSVGSYTPGATYVVSVKYESKSISGSSFAGTPTANYTFASKLNNVDIGGSAGVLQAVANCSDDTPNTPSCTSSLTARSIIGTENIRMEETDSDLRVSAYPNPYNNVVNFQFASPKAGKATLEVYDILGRKLAVVYQGSVIANTPVNVKYNVPSLNRVSLVYKLTVDNKSVKGNILPDRQ